MLELSGLPSLIQPSDKRPLFLLQKGSYGKCSKACHPDSSGPSGDLAGPVPRELSPLANSLFYSSGWSEWATHQEPCLSLSTVGDFQLCSPSRKNNKGAEEEKEYGRYRGTPFYSMKPLENLYWRMNYSFIPRSFAKFYCFPGAVTGTGATAVDETWTFKRGLKEV